MVNAGFLRSSLLKRLESSPRALANTLGVVIRHHEDFLGALAQGKVLRGKALTAWGEADEEVAIAEVLAALADDDLETVGEVADFHADDLRSDVEADLLLLRELHAAAELVANGPDPKAKRLIDELVDIATRAARPGRDGDVTESERRKVIVFSTFADTIEDLHRRVTAAVEGAPADSPLANFRERIAPAGPRSQARDRPNQPRKDPE